MVIGLNVQRNGLSPVFSFEGTFSPITTDVAPTPRRIAKPLDLSLKKMGKAETNFSNLQTAILNFCLCSKEYQRQNMVGTPESASAVPYLSSLQHPA